MTAHTTRHLTPETERRPVPEPRTTSPSLSSTSAAPNVDPEPAYTAPGPIQRLTRDLASASTTLTAGEARFLVDAYYIMQKDRIRTGHQVSALSLVGEPHDILLWLNAQSETLEQQIARALKRYAESNPIGEWLLSIHGIGPIIAAGLLAHLSIRVWTCSVEPHTKGCNSAHPCTPLCGIQPCYTVGHWWRFAGLDPTAIWNKGEKRPHNGRLKTLCWKLGESFVKVSGSDKSQYGKLYLSRKQYEIAKNENGDYSEQARASLTAKRYGKDTEAILWYSGKLTPADSKEYYSTPAEKRIGLAKKMAAKNEGINLQGMPVIGGVPMLPPAHIHSRAKRWAVKIFLSHLHDFWFRHEFKEAPPKPFAIAILGHAHMIEAQEGK